MSQRPGVSQHSFYKWIYAVSPDKSKQQAEELLDAKHEILNLRSQLKRTEEERDILKKGRKVLCKPARVKYQFINESRHQHPTRIMCRMLNVYPSGFYQWLHKPLSNRAIEDQRLLGLIRASYAASRGVYGSRRVFWDLREMGETCGIHRVDKIMKVNGIKALRGYKAPRSMAGRPSIVAPNRLARAFTVNQPDQAWLTDITYIY